MHFSYLRYVLTDHFNNIRGGVKLRSSSIWSSLQLPVTCSLPDPNEHLGALFSVTLSLCSSLNQRDQVSHPYNTGELIVSYILRRDDEICPLEELQCSHHLTSFVAIPLQSDRRSVRSLCLYICTWTSLHNQYNTEGGEFCKVETEGAVINCKETRLLITHLWCRNIQRNI
jgi:hypothetical protein